MGGVDGIGGRAAGGVGSGGATDMTGTGWTTGVAAGALTGLVAFVGDFADAFADAAFFVAAAGRATGFAEPFVGRGLAFADVFTEGAARRGEAAFRLCISFAGRGRAGKERETRCTSAAGPRRGLKWE